MRVVTNQAHVARQMRNGNALLIAAMVVYLAGFVQSCLAPENPVASVVSVVGLGLGTALWLGSQYFVRRWGPRFRQDAALGQALKGLDNRYTLLSFPGRGLPDYLLLGPAGVRVLVARAIDGTVRCQRDRWSRVGTRAWMSLLLGDPLRNPTAEATQGVAQVTRYLERRLAPDDGPRPAVSPIIVFTNPKVRLEIEGSRFPATRARDLRAHLQREKGSLRPTDVARLRAVLAPQASESSS